MKIMLNGTERDVSPETTVSRLIADIKLVPDFVVAELNGRILKKEEYDGAVLSEGAVLELIRFVGGG